MKGKNTERREGDGEEEDEGERVKVRLKEKGEDTGEKGEERRKMNTK